MEKSEYRNMVVYQYHYKSRSRIYGLNLIVFWEINGFCEKIGRNLTDTNTYF